MKRVGWSVPALTLCAVVAALWWRHGSERAQPDAGEPTRPTATAASADATSVKQETAPPPLHGAPPVPHHDYAAQLRAAPDYLEFARSLLDAARAGDHAAQFYIFRALDYCDDGFRGYFKGRGGRKTLDEALKWASTRWPRDSEEILRVHARCHTLMESESDAMDLGDRHEWLQKAAAGAYPLAMVVIAQRQWQATIRTDSDDAEKAEQRRRMVAIAIRSREPEVVWEIGNTVLDFEKNPVGGNDFDHAAWGLAACDRGFDCSPQAAWMWHMCRYDPNCQPYETWPDILRRARGNDFPEIEARARWINEKIDAGDWEALGFGL